MKKYIFLLSILTFALFGHDEVLVEKLVKAGKPFDLSYTLLAITKVESNFGKINVNLQDPSCGLTMIHIKFFLKRYNIKDTNFNRNLACQKLIDNVDLAISEALTVLNYAKSRFCNKWGCTMEQWFKVWAFYNAGNNYNGRAGKRYANKIKQTIQDIKDNKFLSHINIKEIYDGITQTK